MREHSVAVAAPKIDDDSLYGGIIRAGAYLERQDYRGYDPYDCLTSPIFRTPLLSRSSTVQRAAQQILRRLPVNIRPLLGIRPGYNPVTLGLALQAYAYLSVARPDDADLFRDRALRCLSEIRRLKSPGWSGACWGYDFAWQTRHGLLAAGTPTIVATGVITNSLFVAHEMLGDQGALELCESACDFMLRDLPRRIDDDGAVSWAYSPRDSSAVLNATAKGARLLAQVFSQTGQEQLRGMAERSMQFVARYQRADGSWPYAVADERAWVDNFHTGYVLDSLIEYTRLTNDYRFMSVIEKGWKYYRSVFFTSELVPRYYPNRAFPIDATACAQSILTLCAFHDLSSANRVAAWTLAHLQRSDGAFYYQIHRLYRNRITYTRWSVAWMFCALARLYLEQRRCP